MTTPKATKLTAEQLEAVKARHDEDTNGDCPGCSRCALLAHIAALEGERAEARTAIVETMTRSIDRVSEPTARVLKGLGL